MQRLLVDAMNVIGSRPTGWWRDRPAAVRELLARLQGWVAETGHEVVLVLDSAPADLPEGTHDGVAVVHAPRSGPDGADDRIVELVAADAAPATLEVVTADRHLRRRVQDLGAQVRGPRELLDQLDRMDRTDRQGR